MPDDRRLVLIGATGTVGVQTLQLLAADGGPRVVAIAAHSRADALAAQAVALPGVRSFLCSDEQQREELRAFLRDGDYEVCLNAAVGAAGLPYSADVLRAGRTLALANKESLVLAGALLTGLAEQHGGTIVPVDSEHGAIHQCLRGEDPADLRRIHLTASGGALRDLPLEQLAEVTPEQALAHPNWSMGPRITIDSATMMNKAFEVLEAAHLFEVEAERVSVVVHRQSVVHSMVEFIDGSVIAQTGPPDMRYAIQYALHWPRRAESSLPGFDPALYAQLQFEPADLRRWPALELGWQAARHGGVSGACLNAADEIAVAAFLDGTIPYPAITEVCAQVLAEASRDRPRDLDDIFQADRDARERTRYLLPTRTR